MFDFKILVWVIIYWNILFKYVSPFELFSKERWFSRSLNLVPFSGVLNEKFTNLDIYGNVTLFVLPGVYINLTKKNSKLYIKILKMAMLSVAFEAIQFIFCIGASDITDVITNTLGAVIGVGIYYFLKLLLKKPARVKTFVTIASTLMMVLVSVILTAIMIYN